MAKQTKLLFLEDHLITITTTTPTPSQPPSAREIIQSWTSLRDSLVTQSFSPQHFGSLQTLLNSKSSLHVADPQAKLVLNILDNPTLRTSLPLESYPLFLKLLYIWLRKSAKPNGSLVESVVNIVSNLLTINEIGPNVVSFNGAGPTNKAGPTGVWKNGSGLIGLYTNGVLVLGALCVVVGLSEKSRGVCLELLCGVLEERRGAAAEEAVHGVVAAIGYALSACKVEYFSRLLSNLFGLWNVKVGVGRGSVGHGLMVLHLIEWVVTSFVMSRSFERVRVFCEVVSRSCNKGYVEFGLVMATAGALRALNRNVSSVGRPEVRNSLEECIEFIANGLVARTRGFCECNDDLNNRLVLQCIALGLARCGQVSYHGSLFLCLAHAMLTEIFPLRAFYLRFGEYPRNDAIRGYNAVEEHLNCVLFKEGGAMTRVFCSQYVSAEEENKVVVENNIWNYCHDVYSGHRRVSLLLRDRDKRLLEDLEKIAEACFLMVVVFASVVVKNKLNSKWSKEVQYELSVNILVSFSCMEYFRHVRLPEYTDTIMGVVTSVQENENSCVSFIESMPSYTEMTNYTGFSSEKTEIIWSQDGVQTARILFCLRVIPTCIERVHLLIFKEVIAPTMFLYMGHPNAKVSRASHSVFVSFVSSGKDLNQDDREFLKEQLVFFYMKRALEAYPGITPFEGIASGVVALVRNLPAGNPAIFYCINSLVKGANSLCSKAMAQDTEIWKNSEGDSEHCKKLLELLLRLMYLVDIQVLPNLMKQLAQLIVQLPKDGQNMVLDEVYALVAESDDVTRKPALVSWLQSMSFLCSQPIIYSTTTEERSKTYNESLTLNGTSSRL